MKAKIIVSVVFYNSNKYADVNITKICIDVVNNTFCNKIVI